MVHLKKLKLLNSIMLVKYAGIGTGVVGHIYLQLLDAEVLSK